MDKLRWVHLGYQFDYNVVSYRPEKYYGFPEDLGGLMQHIALAIGYPGYIPEAGIVNYYPLGTSMGGHTDHYELDLSWPLVSISFGQTAVFLIGGATRDVRPTGEQDWTLSVRAENVWSVGWGQQSGSHIGCDCIVGTVQDK